VCLEKVHSQQVELHRVHALVAAAR
jgi:hypothetical protein